MALRHLLTMKVWRRRAARDTITIATVGSSISYFSGYAPTARAKSRLEFRGLAFTTSQCVRDWRW